MQKSVFGHSVMDKNVIADVCLFFFVGPAISDKWLFSHTRHPLTCICPLPSQIRNSWPLTSSPTTPTETTIKCTSSSPRERWRRGTGRAPSMHASAEFVRWDSPELCLWIQSTIYFSIEAWVWSVSAAERRRVIWRWSRMLRRHQT